MNEVLSLVPVFIMGVLLGTIFFGGLWWTVQKGLSSTRSAFWFFGSLVVRTIIAIGGFYLIAEGQLDRLLVCLLGFFVARLIVTRLTRPIEEPIDLVQRANHAP